MMSPGVVHVEVNTAALVASIEAGVARLEAAAALAGGAAAESSTAFALMGAALAAVKLKRPVPRRAFLFPWLSASRGRA